MKRVFELFGVAALCVCGFVQTAMADPTEVVDDPALFEAMNLTNTCPANCGSVTLATDPISGIKTVLYTLNSTVPVVGAGDVKVTEFGTGMVGDVLRFENVGGVSDLFLFSGDIGGGFDADVGLPPTYQANTATIAENSSGVTSLYTPTSTQPGYCFLVTGAGCATSIAYELTSPDEVPEPSAVWLFLGGLASMLLIWRLKGKAAFSL